MSASRIRSSTPPGSCAPEALSKNTVSPARTAGKRARASAIADADPEGTAERPSDAAWTVDSESDGERSDEGMDDATRPRGRRRPGHRAVLRATPPGSSVG